MSIFLFIGMFLLLVFSVRIPLETAPYSKVLISRSGEMLAAKVASDEQWRFPQSSDQGIHFFDCVMTFEDAYFPYHPGFNPISLIKAFYINIKSKRIIRGGSTITMQVVRMARARQGRGYWQKFIEILGAIQLEIRFSKQEIFHHWCQLASFGGNIVGAETAAWRYFGRGLDQLSWAEAATLAVLPNAPALIHPGRNRSELKFKRDRLLQKLFQAEYFDSTELILYLAEDIPEKPMAVPNEGLHLLNHCIHQFPDQHFFKSTIDKTLNLQLQRMLAFQLQSLRTDGIRAISALIIDSENNELLAYVGNLPEETGFRFLDLNQVPRSYGSLLKPFLYAYALDEGYLLPNELIADIPTVIEGFQPQNFDKRFRGAVPFSSMVNLSLNVPAVRSLNLVGYREFYKHLSRLKLDYLNKGAEHYGLSIILGGGESNLFSLSNAYHGINRAYHYADDSFSPCRILTDEETKPGIYRLGAFALNHTVKAMSELTRPSSQMGWEKLSSRRKIAWKTGTSYGFRDAWAIGFDRKYTVGVWVGNENGESREGLTGVNKAARAFFEIMNHLSESEEINESRDFKNTLTICKESGKKAGEFCSTKKKISLDRISDLYKTCDYHVVGRISERSTWMPASCLGFGDQGDTIFQLPAFMAHYYRPEHPNYQTLPAIDPDCLENSEEEAIQFIYPNAESNIVLPLESNGVRRTLVAELGCNISGEEIFWFLDDDYLGKTSEEHSYMLTPEPGQHRLHVTGKSGISAAITFNVIWP